MKQFFIVEQWFEESLTRRDPGLSAIVAGAQGAWKKHLVEGYYGSQEAAERQCQKLLPAKPNSTFHVAVEVSRVKLVPQTDKMT